ncbi:MAG: Ltp family lipoprotein, partial [Brachybacterium tyrofermentans]|uniref:Ltp family lipoprotein n=1 Tax=Brachybacterium tyrofermentans TaxID=47848 RepID=UPI003F8E139C
RSTPAPAKSRVDNYRSVNALQSARSYRDSMDMSPEAIRDQLTSEYGEQFTQEQADYAVEHLDD